MVRHGRIAITLPNSPTEVKCPPSRVTHYLPGVCGLAKVGGLLAAAVPETHDSVVLLIVVMG